MGDVGDEVNDLLDRVRLEVHEPEWSIPAWFDKFAEEVERLRAIAVDPATTAGALATLATYLPAEVARNPSLPRILESDPTWWHTLDDFGLDRLWGELDGASAELFVGLTSHPDEEVRAQALKYLRAREPKPSPESIAEAQKEQLAHLARSEDARERELAAEDPATPPDVLVELLTDANPDVRLSAEANPATPSEWLDLMERAEEASWAGIPPDRIEAPEITDDERERLLAAGPHARQVAARQPTLSVERIEALWRTGDRYIRLGILENDATPDEFARRGGSDPDVEVAREAQEIIARRDR